MADVPEFFGHIDDNPASDPAKEAFGEEAENDTPTDNPDDKTKDDKKRTEHPDGDGKDDKPDDKKPEGDGAKPDNTDDGKPAGDKKEEEKPDEKPDPAPKAGEGEEKPEDKKPDEAPQKKNLVLGRYSSVEEAKAAVQRDQEALASLAKPQEPDKLAEEIKAMLDSPLIEPELPDPNHYYVDEKDAEGNVTQRFDMNQYMSDFTRKLVLAMQKEMLVGRLGAANFGQLQKALGESSQKQIEEAEKMQYAEEITGKLEAKFPVLKTDTAIQEKFERLIWGEGTRRQNIAKAEGKEAEPLSYEDYENLLIEVVGKTEVQGVTPEPSPTEKPKGGPSFTPQKTNRSGDGVADDIEAMLERSSKKSIF